MWHRGVHHALDQQCTAPPLAWAGGAIACGYIKCVGETKGLAKRPDRLMRLPEAAASGRKGDCTTLVIAISAKTFRSLK
jgi:hypothetical protein